MSNNHSNNHAPHNNIVARASNGRFQPGHPGGPGRPSLAEGQRELAVSIRREIARYKLVPERMAMMAAGVGKYAKLGAKTQHAITMDLISYGFGKPAQITYSDVDAEVTVVKRIVGVNYDDDV
jgi:hypothetical protein